jgi:serine phosphatase RsbU (regulator of sigma subunit)
MKLTRTFKVSGLLTAAGVLFASLGHGGAASVPGIFLIVFAGPVFCVSAIRALLRGLLWRVGSRLVVSYLLLLSAVVFAAFFVYAGLLVVAGQLGTRRVEAALTRRREAAAALAHDLAPRLEGARDAAAHARAFTEAVAASPTPSELGMIWQPTGATPERTGTQAGPDLAPQAWMTSRSSFVAKAGKSVFAAAVEPRPAGTLVLTLRLGSVLRRGIEKETGNIIRFHGAVTVREQPAGAPKGKGVHVSLTEGGGKASTSTDISVDPDSGGEDAASGETAAPPAGSGPWSARWTAFPLFLTDPVVDWATGKTLEGRPILILVRTSLEREAKDLFGDLSVRGSRRLQMSRVVLAVLGGLGLATIAVFFLASLLAGLLVYRIARATRRLSVAFGEIEKGNFAHRAVLKGRDQLAALVESFNHMAERLAASVAARAEKDALERELELARDLQRRLLPPAGFTFPGVSIAVDFRPAAAIGGDFYDLSGDARTLTVVVADVSGHGLPTGIVMAASKASLSALAKTGASGTRLMELLDVEVVRSTDPRTFVTLAHLAFDLAAGTVAFTNAGHPYPYRVRPDGTVEALVNAARPLGVALPPGWQTVTAPLAPGDLWIVYSDGLVEAATEEGGEPWGFGRLEQCLREGAGGPAAALRDRILASQRAYTGHDELDDDRTLLVLRIEERGGDALPRN